MPNFLQQTHLSESCHINSSTNSFATQKIDTVPYSHGQRKICPKQICQNPRSFLKRAMEKDWEDFLAGHARYKIAGKMAGKDLRKFAEFGRKIIGVGRNYKDHARELGNTLPEKPLLFLKPTSSYIHEGEKIKIPSGCSELHHEVELGVVIGQSGSQIDKSKAMDYVGGYVLALDMTARDYQREAVKKGLPWLLAKGFDTSCPISEFIPKEMLPNPDGVRLWLKTDGTMKQDGNTKDMVFQLPFLISYISKIVTLEEGDLILTGTPAGVSAVTAGQQITAGLDTSFQMSFAVAE